MGQGPALVAGLLATAGAPFPALTQLGNADAVSKLAWPDIGADLDARLLLRKVEEALAKPGK